MLSGNKKRAISSGFFIFLLLSLSFHVFDGEELGQLGLNGIIFREGCEVSPFVRITVMVIQFFSRVAVKNIVPTFV